MIGDGFGILVVGIAMFMWDVLFFIRVQGAVSHLVGMLQTEKMFEAYQWEAVMNLFAI